MKARYTKYVLNFKRPSGTSRGILRQKETYFIELRDGGNVGIGECGLLRGLSVDDVPMYEQQLAVVCDALQEEKNAFALCADYPSIQMGVETALMSLRALSPFQLFDTAFSRGEKSIPINGLVWMGELDFMRKQVFKKIEEGYRCIKLKIGALDFDAECQLLTEIRDRYHVSEVELRVDANGAFSTEEVLEKLAVLASFDLHSIEQPIAAGQVTEMASLCANTPLPIALDEELIGVHGLEEKKALLDTIKPQYLILKPSLLGGFNASMEWINLAKERHIGWWITSALESNVGLNAIAQWVSTLETSLPQGLGTGSLFTNNIDSPLVAKQGFLHVNPSLDWMFFK